MDPQVTWEQMLSALAHQDWTEVHECATALIEWLGRGGFPPKVVADPPLGNAFNAALANTACTFALVECQRATHGPSQP